MRSHGCTTHRPAEQVRHLPTARAGSPDTSGDTSDPDAAIAAVVAGATSAPYSERCASAVADSSDTGSSADTADPDAAVASVAAHSPDTAPPWCWCSSPSVIVYPGAPTDPADSDASIGAVAAGATRMPVGSVGVTDGH